MRRSAFARATAALWHRAGAGTARVGYSAGRGQARRRTQLPEPHAAAFFDDAQARRAASAAGTALHNVRTAFLIPSGGMPHWRSFPLLHWTGQPEIVRAPHGYGRGCALHAFFARTGTAYRVRSGRAAARRTALADGRTRWRAHDHRHGAGGGTTARAGGTRLLRRDLCDAAAAAHATDQQHRPERLVEGRGGNRCAGRSARAAALCDRRRDQTRPAGCGWRGRFAAFGWKHFYGGGGPGLLQL